MCSRVVALISGIVVFSADSSLRAILSKAVTLICSDVEMVLGTSRVEK
jgi:hypothetical protein